jgi:hypothetical protein
VTLIAGGRDFRLYSGDLIISLRRDLFVDARQSQPQIVWYATDYGVVIAPVFSELSYRHSILIVTKFETNGTMNANQDGV